MLNQSCSLDPWGDARFAWDAGLTQPAAIAFEAEVPWNVLPGHSDVLGAKIFVVSFLANGAYRAAFDAVSAGSLRIEQAVSVMILVWLFARRDLHPSDDQSHPYCLSSGGD